jgi:nitrite reductase/ring-hydroxylating ferredoxin subunit
MAERIFLTKISDFPGRGRGVFNLDGRQILVIRLDDGYCGLVNRCPHMGFPLTNARVEGHTLTCPLHNSQFDLCSGDNQDWVRGLAGTPMPGWIRGMLAMGRKPASLRTYPVLVEGDSLYIEL